MTGGIANLDDYNACEISQKRDWRDIFVTPFYFGCEADDPSKVWALNARANPGATSMGAWGTGLYSGDFAVDLRASIAAVSRLPLDDEALVDAVCEAERSAATNPADENHTVFWLVLADQFEKRGISSRRVRETALDIIDGGKDAAMMQALGMKSADIRQRARKLAQLRTRLIAQPESSRPRKTLSEPQRYVFQLYGVYAYPTCGGEPINPYISTKRFDRAAWHSDGFGRHCQENRLLDRRGSA